MLKICLKFVSRQIIRPQNYTNIQTKPYNNNNESQIRIFKNLLFIFIAFCLINKTIAQYNPCSGKAQLGEGCEIDSDCENKGSVCLRGTCHCHPHYIRVTSEKGGTRCLRLPAKIGQECTQKCRDPLFCRNGQCQCVQRGSTSIINGECVSVSRIGDRCSRHYDCTSPFSACVNQQCVCISGTIQQGSKCVASTNCPLGGNPGAICTRRAHLNQIVNFVEEADTCQPGQYCVTTPDSPIGQCCPVLCPLNSNVDLNYNCVPGEQSSRKQSPSSASRSTTPAPNFPSFVRDFTTLSVPNLLSILPLKKQKCPVDTHFCHYITGETFAQAVCCKRPCNAMAPEALYLNGECVARGQLNSECQHNEQCAATEGMECVKRQCQCVKGFLPAVDVLTHPVKNPSQQCVINCDKKTSLSRDTTCMNFTQLGESCFVQEQCPENSGCYRGRCICRCKYRMDSSGKKCILIPQTTTVQTPSPPLVPVLTGPLNINNIGNIFGRFFGGDNRSGRSIII